MEFNKLSGAVMAITLVGLLLAVGLIVHDTFREETELTVTAKETNLTINLLTNATLTNTEEVTCLNVTRYNQPANETTSYTCYDNGNIILTANDPPLNATGCDIYYTYDTDSVTGTNINTVISALGDFSGWLALIVLVIAASVILVIVTKDWF